MSALEAKDEIEKPRADLRRSGAYKPRLGPASTSVKAACGEWRVARNRSLNLRYIRDSGREALAISPLATYHTPLSFGGLASESNGGLTGLHPRCVAPPPPGRRKEHGRFIPWALRSRNQARLLLAKP
jgi:hypothetical protein